MKKLICLCLCIMICFTSFNAVFAEYNENPRELEQSDYETIVRRNIRNAINMLSQLDIVRNPLEKWGKDDPIKRRNAFEMVYIVRYEGSRELPKPENTLPKWMQDPLYFTDIVPGTYDYALFDALNYDFLIFGRENSKEKFIAAFDENITYYEAISLVSRLFTVQNRIKYTVRGVMESWETDYQDYRFAEEIGLINSNNLVNYSTLTVDKSQLNEPIPAYEFMYLLYTALYIPTFECDDYGGLPGQIRYIDYFTKPAPPEIELDEDVIYIP